MLYVERSNRTENLLEGLAERLMSPRSNPLSPSFVVVQGQGMERWIAQAIAREYGVCANTEFLFPRNLLERVFGAAEAADSNAPAPNPGWQTDSLLWSIARRIETSKGAPELAALARQLESPDRGWRLIQLASQIAHRFDDYITYRPDWIQRWSTEEARSATAPLGADEAWQAWLFRGVLDDLGPGHFAGRAIRFVENVQSGPSGELTSTIESAFPSAIEVFAVSTLPPLYLSVLDGLSQMIDVRLSVLSPSRHYWADLWSEVRDEAESTDSLASPDSIASLLVGLGHLGGDFQRSLEQVSGYVEAEPDRFEAPSEDGGERTSILRRLQTRLLELDVDAGLASPADRLVSLDDRSIRIHVCHGPKRELEAVEASLREAFDLDPTLTPEDVIVMAPEIDSLIPTIEAVFGAGNAGGDGEATRIPFRIADRSTLRRSPVVEAFVGLLTLLPGRAGRSELLDWLSLEPARAKLGLDGEGVDRLGDWAARAGVRFGLDERHRETLELADSRRHTWAGGIDRLVLGHAMGPDAAILEGLSPEPLGPFSDPSLLGAVGELEETLSAARSELSRPRSVQDWGGWLTALLAATLDHRDDNAHEHGLIRSAIQQLAAAAGNATFEEPIPFEAMRERFVRAIEASPPAQGFLSGGVTFCELVPLRAIPFRVIAIVGLSDTNFPRRRPAVSYDLIARHPRGGDRNSRNDDRYLFLEAILSTRDQLILTVPGHDLRDGSDLPPSVVISELLDTLDATFESGDPKAFSGVREQLVVSHPIHGFSSRYFEAKGDARMVGLDEEAYEGAMARRQALRDLGGERRRFLRVLEAPHEGRDRLAEPHLNLDDLIERILRSTRVFARNRLGMRLPRPERAIGDFDPTQIDGLDRYVLGDASLADLRDGSSEAEVLDRLLASPLLPGGDPGRLLARSLEREVVSTFSIARARMGEALPGERAFDLTLEDVGSIGRARLTGTLRNVTAKGLVRLEFARFGGRSELAFWIQHLAYCALVEGGASAETESRFIARAESSTRSNRVSTFSHVPDAKKELATLFEWAWSVDLAPLPLFPRTSRVFATHLADGKEEQAWRDAHQKFYGGESGSFGQAESEEDLEWIRVWEGSHPLEPSEEGSTLYAFDWIAERFFRPFFAAREVHEK